MRFSQFPQITPGLLSTSEDVEILHFSTDTRSLMGRKGEVFVALKGHRDGHDFVDEARRIGATNFIVSEEIDLPKECNVFHVKDTLTAFQELAAYHRTQFEIPIVGITGSNGKTTVKEWLATLLSQKYFVAKNPKSYNSQIGVPISILTLGDNHEVGLFEAGISQRDEMERLGKIIQPTLGVFTTLGEAHDEGYSSKEEKL